MKDAIKHKDILSNKIDELLENASNLTDEEYHAMQERIHQETSDEWYNKLSDRYTEFNENQIRYIVSHVFEYIAKHQDIDLVLDDEISLIRTVNYLEDQ